MDDAAQNQVNDQFAGQPVNQPMRDNPAMVLRQILGDDQGQTATQLTQQPVNQPVVDDVVTTVAQGGLGVAQPSLPPPPEPISVPNKEAGPLTGNAEAVPLVELREDEKIPEEVQGWVEKLQKEDITLPKPIQANGEVVLAEPSVKFVDDKIVLPLTQQSFTQSAQAKVTQSIRWLHEWCKRVILMQGEEKTKFRD